jgi:hypothetical protein
MVDANSALGSVFFTYNWPVRSQNTCGTQMLEKRDD